MFNIMPHVKRTCLMSGFFFFFIYFFTYFPLSQLFFFLVTNWPMTGLDWAGYAQVCHKLKDLAELMREANDNSPSLLSFGEQFSCIQSHFSVYIRKTKLLFPTASSVLLLSLRWIGEDVPSFSWRKSLPSNKSVWQHI